MKRIKTIKSDYPPIFQYLHKGRTRYVLDCRKRGYIGKQRFFFKSLNDSQLKRTEIQHQISSIGFQGTSIVQQNGMELVYLNDLLQRKGLSLTDGIHLLKDHLNHTENRLKTPPVSQLIDSWMNEKLNNTLKSLSTRTLQGVRQIGLKMKRVFNDCLISHISQKQIEDYLRGMDCSNRTRHNLKVQMSEFFNWSVSKEFITKNPCQNIEITVERKLPSILSVDEVTLLITTTLKLDPELIPYLTVGIFGGLRPSSEIPTVKSSHFHFQQKQLYVNSPKVKKERFVPLSDNLIEWLTLYPIKNDSLIVTNHRSRFNRIKKQSGVKWSPDIMRHSFGSYFMGKNQNIYSCSEGMGNSPSVIKRFYQRPILSDDVERFWSLSPKTMGKE